MQKLHPKVLTITDKGKRDQVINELVNYQGFEVRSSGNEVRVYPRANKANLGR